MDTPAVGTEAFRREALAIAESAIADAIRELGTVPAGTLYAYLCGVMSADTFNALVAALVAKGLVRRAKSHLLTWVGPEGAT